MRGLALFVAAVVVIVLVGGLMLTRVWPSPEAARAIRASAIVAVVVQLFAFGIVRLGRRSNVVAAWGLGMLLRFSVFVVYALVLVKSLALAGPPALVSLALFFFLSTLVEPLLLNV